MHLADKINFNQSHPMASIVSNTKEYDSSVGLLQIGILCIDAAKSLLDTIKSDDIQSYIPASYVKFLNSAGADIVPIWIGRERGYYKTLLSQLKGVLIPGGAVFFVSKSDCLLPNDCVESSKYIFEIASELNDRGIYFPIWGTCLGLQLLLFQAAGGKAESEEIRSDCNPMNYSLPITFGNQFHNSKMFANLDEDLKCIMETEDIGYHYHRYCVTQKSLERFQLADDWQILATNKDDDGLEFITFIEHKRFPFYGAQVHLERNAYEILSDDVDDGCNHSEKCVKAAEYFAKFFISECLKCTQTFEKAEESLGHSISNFQAIKTAKTHWLECYLFNRESDYAFKNVNQ